MGRGVGVAVGGNQTIVAVGVSVGGRGVWVGNGGSGVGEARHADRMAANKMKLVNLKVLQHVWFEGF